MIDRRLFLSLMFVATGAVDLADIASPNREQLQHVGPFCVRTDRDAEKCRRFIERYPRIAAKLPEGFETKQGDSLIAAGVHISNPRSHYDSHYYPHRDLALSILQRLGVSTDLDLEESPFRRCFARQLMRLDGNLTQKHESSSIDLRLACNRDEVISFPIAQLPAPGQTATAVNRFNIARIKHQPGNQCTSKIVCEQIALADTGYTDTFSAASRGEFYLDTFLGKSFKIPTKTLERMFRGETVAILGSCNGIIKAKILKSEPTEFGFRYWIVEVLTFCFQQGRLQLMDSMWKWRFADATAGGHLLQKVKARCSIDASGSLIVPMCCGRLVISPNRVQRCVLGENIFLKPKGYCLGKGEKHLMTFSSGEVGSGVISIMEDPYA